MGSWGEGGRGAEERAEDSHMTFSSNLPFNKPIGAKNKGGTGGSGQTSACSSLRTL